MVNRELIRLKVVQLVYAFYKDEGKQLEIAERELAFSLNKAYELYLYLLSLLVEVRKFAERRDAVRLAREKRTGETAEKGSAAWLIAENQVLKQLAENKTLIDFQENQKGEWPEEEATVRKIFTALTESEYFEDYRTGGNYTYDGDREMVRRLYKTLICDNDDIDSSLEDHSLYWNDDKTIIDSFVLKTIKRFRPETDAEAELLPVYTAEEDKTFAQTLFHAAIVRRDELEELISHSTRNWEIERLAFMDTVIMQIALAEILTFDSIPLSVTFSEYLNIARMYSTPKSAAYINGVLDNVVKQLHAEGRIEKQPKA